MAACTSRAAALMSRLRSNCSVTCADPTELREVISVTPAMRVNCFSSGVATDAAITSGLAPGQVGEDRDGREVDLRQRRDRQQRIGDAAGQRHRDQQQRGGDRSLNEWRGDAHIVQPYVSSGTRTRSSRLLRNCATGRPRPRSVRRTNR